MNQTTATMQADHQGSTRDMHQHASFLLTNKRRFLFLDGFPISNNPLPPPCVMSWKGKGFGQCSRTANLELDTATNEKEKEGPRSESNPAARKCVDVTSSNHAVQPKINEVCTHKSYSVALEGSLTFDRKEALKEGPVCRFFSSLDRPTVAGTMDQRATVSVSLL